MLFCGGGSNIVVYSFFNSNFDASVCVLMELAIPPPVSSARAIPTIPPPRSCEKEEDGMVMVRMVGGG